MKIWYFHPYGGGPGVGRYFRPYELGRRWEAQGHEVCVFVASYHHLMDMEISRWKARDVGGVTYRTISTNRYRGNGLGRIMNMVRYALGMIRLARTSPPDVIVVSSPHPFVVYGGWGLSRLMRRPFVYEIRDLWPLSLTELIGVSRWHPFVLLCAHAERFGGRSAAMVVGLLAGIGDYLAERGLEFKKFAWLPNGADLTRSTNSTPVSGPGRRAAALIKEWRAQGRVIMISAGSLGPPNGVEAMIGGLKVAIGRLPPRRLGVLMLGDGISAPHLRAQVANAQMEDAVFFAGSVPKQEALFLIDQADFAYAGIKDVPELYRFGTSLNKVMDYLASGKPVIFPISVAGEPVRESGAGFALETDSPASIAQAIVSLAEMDDGSRQALGKLGLEHVRRYFDWDQIAEAYLKHFETLCRPRPSTL